MSPEVLGSVLQALGPLNLGSLLQVLMGASPADERQIRDIRLLQGFLDNPTIAPAIWAKAEQYVQDKPWLPMVLSTIQAAAKAHGVAGPADPAELTTYRQPIVDILSAITSNEPQVRLHAISQCPSCNYIYGATTST